MSISRRKFFQGFARQGEGRQRRIDESRAYVRAHFLPYDFALTDDQISNILDATVTRIGLDSSDEPLTEDQKNRLRTIAEEEIERYRQEYLRAEEVREAGVLLVTAFLRQEAFPEDLEGLRRRFQVPQSESLDDEIERQVRFWISSLSNARLSACSEDTLKELVFSEIRSWC